MFSNKQIQLSDIPSIQDIELSPVSSSFFWIILFNWSLVFLILFCAFSFTYYFADNSPFERFYFEICGGIIGLYLFFLIISFMALKKRQYALREKDVVYSKGLVVFTLITVPISRIQHVEESRSFLERQFNLATLKIFTAGDAGSDLSIRGLAHKEAKIINDFISSRISHEN